MAGAAPDTAPSSSARYNNDEPHKGGNVDRDEIFARIFHRTGDPYMLMPDHAPSHPDDKHPPGVSVRVSQGWAVPTP